MAESSRDGVDFSGGFSNLPTLKEIKKDEMLKLNEAVTRYDVFSIWPMVISLTLSSAALHL